MKALWAAGIVSLFLAWPAAAGTLTGSERLSQVYDAILDARFDRADTLLAHACPPAPAAACRTLDAVSLWWQININPETRALDDRFNRAADQAIAAGEAWTEREPQSAEAWFYLAGAYAPRVQWRVLRGEKLAAARDGKIIKDALERALARNPSLEDAYFGIGLYHYYADVAPLGAKILRFLLMLPGGDRQQGLREMLEAREHGELMTGEADYQLHLVYLWYEQKPQAARDLVEALEHRYPHNPLFVQRVAEIDDEYFHDLPASAAAWQRLIELAASGQVATPRAAEARARLGLASAAARMGEPSRAIAQLDAVRAMHPKLPPDAAARAELQRGDVYVDLGRRDLAIAAFTAAARLAPDDDPHHVRDRARRALDRLSP